MNALKVVLGQGAAYFDQLETANAKLVQRITNDTENCRAVSYIFKLMIWLFVKACDYRLYHMVNNVFFKLMQAVLSLIVKWQIAINAIALYGRNISCGTCGKLNLPNFK